MPYDSFSNEEIPKGTGIMYVRKDGTVLYFKSSKTFKNMLKLKREGRKMRWTRKSLSLTTEKKKEEKKESALAKDIEQKLAAKHAKEEKK
ncbi:MAG: 50S ribosomal protein L24e [Candidatus Micrarchaeota archaeon]